MDVSPWLCHLSFHSQPSALLLPHKSSGLFLSFFFFLSLIYLEPEKGWVCHVVTYDIMDLGEQRG